MIRFGSNTPAEGLRQLPSFVGSTENENNSALGTGAAQINLRAFGSRNTLRRLGRENKPDEAGNEFHARTRRRKNWRGKIRFWETFAPWPLCVSL